MTSRRGRPPRPDLAPKIFKVDPATDGRIDWWATEHACDRSEAVREMVARAVEDYRREHGLEDDPAR